MPIEIKEVGLVGLGTHTADQATTGWIMTGKERAYVAEPNGRFSGHVSAYASLSKKLEFAERALRAAKEIIETRHRGDDTYHAEARWLIDHSPAIRAIDDGGVS